MHQKIINFNKETRNGQDKLLITDALNRRQRWESILVTLLKEFKQNSNPLSWENSVRSCVKRCNIKRTIVYSNQNDSFRDQQGWTRSQ
jgi:hypothetical protein